MAKVRKTAVLNNTQQKNLRTVSAEEPSKKLLRIQSEIPDVIYDSNQIVNIP